MNSILCCLFCLLQAYTSQFVALIMFALLMCDDRISVQPRRREIIQGLKVLPGKHKYSCECFRTIWNSARMASSVISYSQYMNSKPFFVHICSLCTFKLVRCWCHRACKCLCSRIGVQGGADGLGQLSQSLLEVFIGPQVSAGAPPLPLLSPVLSFSLCGFFVRLPSQWGRECVGSQLLKFPLHSSLLFMLKTADSVINVCMFWSLYLQFLAQNICMQLHEHSCILKCVHMYVSYSQPCHKGCCSRHYICCFLWSSTTVVVEQQFEKILVS